MTDPVRALTNRERQVIDLLALGWSYARIGKTIRRSPETVRRHVANVALVLPNPQALPARTLVMLWAADRRSVA